MPAGALWRIRYNDDLDHRIQARADRQRFAQDRNVLTATTRYYEGVFLLEVQLIDDAESTFDERLHELYNRHSYSENRSFPILHQGTRPEPNSESPRPIVPEVRTRIISEYIRTSSGRQQLARAMIRPLSSNRPLSSIARRTFLVEQLPDGVLPIYSKDLVNEFDPPIWVTAGTWVRNGSDYAIIVATEPKNTEELPFNSAQVVYQVWRDYGPSKKLDAETFCKNWLPSEIPAEPRTRFERILMDDD